MRADEISWIEIAPDTFGWKLRIYTIGADGIPEQRVFGIGDVIQWVHETERTLSKWLADGPADFHGATDRPALEREAYLTHVKSDDPENDPEVAAAFDRLHNPDLARDIERGK